MPTRRSWRAGIDCKSVAFGLKRFESFGTHMDKRNLKKNKQLEMNASTASHRLRRNIMYHLAKKLGEHYCYQCGAEIESVEDFTVEHKVPWIDSPNPRELFFSMDNIAFSHYSCNIGAARRILSICPSLASYKKGCRCLECVELHRTSTRNGMKRHRERKQAPLA